MIPKDSEKGPIDLWLDGFEFPGLPKSANEVYKVKGKIIRSRDSHRQALNGLISWLKYSDSLTWAARNET